MLFDELFESAGNIIPKGRYNDWDFYAYDPNTMELKMSWSDRDSSAPTKEQRAREHGWEFKKGSHFNYGKEKLRQADKAQSVEEAIPPHIKPSDLPPAMRSRPLTMRDIEAERPKGAYRYRVGDKEFLDLKSAQEFASGTGQRVQPISEVKKKLDEQSPTARGLTNYMLLAKSAEQEPITLQFVDGRIQVRDPLLKKYIFRELKRALDRDNLEKGKTPQPDLLAEPSIYGKYQDNFLRAMSTMRGFRDITDGYYKLFKKPRDPESDIPMSEAERGQVSARTQRMLDKIRTRQPQATSDLEALAYDLEDQQAQDRKDIERLERERDDIESEVKQDLEQQIGKLRGKRTTAPAALDKLRSDDERQNAALDRLQKIVQQKDALDAEQNQAIDDLERNLQQRPRASLAPSVSTTPATQPTAQPKRDRSAQRQARGPVEPAAQQQKSKERRAARASQIARPVAPGTGEIVEPGAETPSAGAQSNVIDLAKERERIRAAAQQAQQTQKATGTHGPQAGLFEKKRPVPTNKELWGRAKAAARSKFDVYPSAYANAWASKWYKAHGGGWRMGKK